jgi:hypothetical protein
MSANFTDRSNIIDSETPLLNYVNINKCIFTVTSEQLQSIVEHPSLLSQLGGVDEISRLLFADPNTGLMSDESFDTNYGVTALKKEQGDDDFSFMERKHIFGKNSIPEAPSKSLLQLIWTAYNDQTLGNWLIPLKKKQDYQRSFFKLCSYAKYSCHYIFSSRYLGG